MRQLLVLFLIFFNFHVFGQKTTEMVEKNGKKYYLHTVKQGSTLFSICKDYEVLVDEVTALNPNLNAGIKIGQKILIPIIGESAKSFSYTVKEGETFFSILKKYNLKEEDVLKLNPGMSKNLQMDQVILLPGDYMKYRNEVNVVPKIADTVIVHEVLEHETLYSISKRFMLTVDEVAKLNKVSSKDIKPGMKLQIPIYGKENKDVLIRSLTEVNIKIDSVVNNVNEVAHSNNITFLLPFLADKQNDPTGAIATEFYMGAQLAIDSLVKLGFEGKVYVHDVGMDTTQLKPLLDLEETKSSSLLIGPFNGENLDYASEYAKKNTKILVSPIVATTSYLKNNPYVYNASTSEITLVKKMAKYVYSAHLNDQVILVKVGPKDEELYNAFRSSFLAKGNKKLYETTEKELSSFVKKGKNIVFVVLSRERVFSTKIADKIHLLALKPTSPDITLFGLKEWAYFEDIPAEVKNKLHFHYSASVNFDTKSEEVKVLKDLYKQKYNTQLTKYAAQGFDVTMNYISQFFLNKQNNKGVINHFVSKSIMEGSGFENTACFIFKQEDFVVTKIAEVNE
jgi:LysM repeat protein/ABC-type branched-subunit amino acid transport system substrate-binding protein